MSMFVTLVLDQSGSMGEVRNGVRVKEKTIEGYNAYVHGLQAQEPGALFTLILFSQYGVEVRHRALEARYVPKLTDATYSPRGGTPLIDACMKAIKATEERAPEDAPVVIVIQTDGEENQSREYTKAQLQDKIREKTAAGWLFMFLGAGLEAFAQAAQFGIQPDVALNYAGANTVDAFNVGTRSTLSYMAHGGGAAGQSVAAFTLEERTSANPPAPVAQPLADEITI